MKWLAWRSVVYGTMWIVLALAPARSLGTPPSPDTLRVAYTSAPPFIIQNETGLSGINFWLWKAVAQELDLVYELQPLGFADMLQALENGTVDVSINPLTITSERSRRMLFTHSYYASNSTVAIYESSFWQKLTGFVGSFFNVNFLRGFLVLLLIIFVFGVLIWSSERRLNPKQFRSGWVGVWDGVWWSVVTMTTVGYGDKAPLSKAGKAIALIWMFSGLLFISGLTASVASMLTVNELNAQHDDFIAFKDQAVGSIANSSTKEFLEERFFTDVRAYGNVVAGLDDLTDHKIEAFLYDEPILKYRLKQNAAYRDLRILPIQFDLQFYAFGLSRGQAGLEEEISQKILEITERMEWQIILNEYGLAGV